MDRCGAPCSLLYINHTVKISGIYIDLYVISLAVSFSTGLTYIAMSCSFGHYGITLWAALPTVDFSLLTVAALHASKRMPTNTAGKGAVVYAGGSDIVPDAVHAFVFPFISCHCRRPPISHSCLLYRWRPPLPINCDNFPVNPYT